MHRDVEYTVALSENSDRWTWQFSIGGAVKTGKVTAKLDLYASASSINKSIANFANATRINGPRNKGGHDAQYLAADQALMAAGYFDLSQWAFLTIDDDLG